jgi:hypothetical protein
MPKSKTTNPVILDLIKQQEAAEQAVKDLRAIPDVTYDDRSNYGGKGSKSADYQGPGSIGGEVIVPGTNDRMPGTTPIIPEQPKSDLDRIFEYLQITPRKPDKKPAKSKYPGFT